MKKEAGKEIVLIGAGNLAWHLGPALQKAGHSIIQIAGKTESSTKALAERLNTNYSTTLRELNQSAAIYILCVPDTEIPKITKQLFLKNKWVLHTSGTTSLKVLKTSSNRTGVIYPLQTFSKNDKINFNKVPLLVEANTSTFLNELKLFCSGISREVIMANSEERSRYHLAAVIAANFSNHLYYLSQQFLEKEGIKNTNVLLPLIRQTAKKTKRLTPFEAQTGPARRNDLKTIQKHLLLLSKHEELQDIYGSLTESILKTYHER